MSISFYPQQFLILHPIPFPSFPSSAQHADPHLFLLLVNYSCSLLPLQCPPQPLSLFQHISHFFLSFSVSLRRSSFVLRFFIDYSCSLPPRPLFLLLPSLTMPLTALLTPSICLFLPRLIHRLSTQLFTCFSFLSIIRVLSLRGLCSRPIPPLQSPPQPLPLPHRVSVSNPYHFKGLGALRLSSLSHSQSLSPFSLIQSMAGFSSPWRRCWVWRGGGGRQEGGFGQCYQMTTLSTSYFSFSVYIRKTWMPYRALT